MGFLGGRIDTIIHREEVTWTIIAKKCEKEYFCESAVPENIHPPPTEEIGISWGVGGSARPKNLKKCMKPNWNLQRGCGVLEKILSVGEVWIFSEITQYQCFAVK